MKKFIENFITFIIVIITFIISSGTVYFCLDVFGIIDVPQKYSIASLFYSRIETIASGGSLMEDLIEEDFSKISQNENKEISDDKNQTEEVGASDVKNPLEELKKIQEEQKLEEKTYLNNTSVNVDNFYYDQLDAYGKIIYDKLYANIDRLKTGTYTADFDTTFNDLLHEENGTEILNNSFQLAINALTFDNPDLFYIDVTKMYLLTEITTRAFSKTYKVSIGGNGNSYLTEEFKNETYVNNAINNVEKIKKEILDNCSGTTVDKIKTIHDYLVDTIEYDLEAGNNIYNIYGALINRRAVCEGYARAFKYVLDDLEIPSIIACGMAKNSAGTTESHAWNYVKIDNEWYAIDVTWDDPVIIGNGRIDESIKYKYFLRGGNEFFEDHFEDGNIVGESGFKYPSLRVLDYEN